MFRQLPDDCCEGSPEDTVTVFSGVTSYLETNINNSELLSDELTIKLSSEHKRINCCAISGMCMLLEDVCASLNSKTYNR